MSDFISKKRLKWEVEKWYEKEYYSSFNAAVYNALLKIIDKFPSVEQENYGDCISREAALNALEALEQDAPSAKHASAIFDCEDTIKRLPSVKPERPRGHWEYIEYDGNPKIGNWYCSECGRIVFLLHSQKLNELPLYDFCPWCGADMRGEQALKYADNKTAFGGLQSAT